MSEIKVDAMDLAPEDIPRLEEIIQQLKVEKSETGGGLCVPLRSVDGNEWELADDWYGTRKGGKE